MTGRAGWTSGGGGTISANVVHNAAKHNPNVVANPREHTQAIRAHLFLSDPWDIDLYICEAGHSEVRCFGFSVF